VKINSKHPRPGNAGPGGCIQRLSRGKKLQRSARVRRGGSRRCVVPYCIRLLLFERPSRALFKDLPCNADPPLLDHEIPWLEDKPGCPERDNLHGPQDDGFRRLNDDASRKDRWKGASRPEEESGESLYLEA